MLKRVFQYFSKNNLKKYILIIVGTLSWSITMVKSGWNYSYGLGFWGANGHDAIWHIALAENLAKANFTMPIFSGAKIQNYHIGFDLILAIIHKITFISIPALYFQILPGILALLVGLLTYKLVLDWSKSEKAAWWSTFFVYFGGGFEYFLGKGESVFWSTQAISTLINPPFALSLVIILAGLIFLAKFTESNKFKYLLLSSLLFGILIEVKVYGGLLIFGGLLVSGLYLLIFKHNLSIIKVFLGSLLVGLPMYLLFNKASAGLMLWQPFWFLEQMMGDRLGWQKFHSAMTTYKFGHIWIKGIIAYLTAFFIFILGNLGTRIIFLFNKNKLDFLRVFMYSIIAAGIVIPTFFLQKGTSWNTIQFFYYSLFFSSILAGVSLSKFSKNIIYRYMICPAIFLLTIPTTIVTLKDVYIPARPPAMLPNNEISALKFLSIRPNGIVLTYPFDQKKSDDAVTNPPRPLYLYTSTAYVSAFSKKIVFMEDEINLDITNYPWEERRSEILSWYKETDVFKAKEFLKENNISYVYWLDGQKSFLTPNELGLKEIYNKASVMIYQVEE